MMIHESKWLSIILISLFLPAFAVAASGSTKDYTWLLFLKVNKPPQVVAGGDQTITNNSAFLAATVTDDPRDTLSYTWSYEGSGTVDFDPADTLQTTATFYASGQYTLVFTANDGEFEVTDSVKITVTNTAPQVNAGPDKQITAPVSSVFLDASVSDNENNIQTIAWSKVSGPGSVTFTNPSSVDTNVTFGATGSYELQLTASDWEFPGIYDRVKVNYLPQPAPVIDVVVVVGDSIEVGLGDNDCTMCVAWLVDYGTVPPQEEWSKECTGYTVPLAQRLSVAPGFASSVDVRERGMSGASSSQGAAKIEAFVQNNYDAEVFLIGYGTNDAGGDVPPSIFRSNMEKIIKAVKAEEMEPIVQYIPYVKYPKDALNDDIALLNAEIYSLTQQYNLRQGPSFFAYFRDNQSQLNSNKEWCAAYGYPYYNPPDDGIHPTRTGYSNMARLWAEILIQ